MSNEIDYVCYPEDFEKQNVYRRDYQIGLDNGRRQALEEAARAAGQALIPEDCSPAEAHGRLMQAAASRDAVLALIKDPKV